MSAWENDDGLDDDGLDDEVGDPCVRCGSPIGDGDGAIVTQDWGPGDVQEWSFCIECMDSFTAWRLTPAPASSHSTSAEEPPF